MRRIILIAASFLLPLGAAQAQDGCDKFAWPLTHERTLFAATNKVAVKAGDTLPALPSAAVTLQLRPGNEVKFAMPPERKPKAEKWSGGTLHFPALAKPGIYQVTLSDEAWVDVVQDGRYARSVGHSGRGDCPGLRKAVRFELTAAPFVVQVSGAEVDTVAIAVGAAP